MDFFQELLLLKTQNSQLQLEALLHNAIDFKFLKLARLQENKKGSLLNTNLLTGKLRENLKKKYIYIKKKYISTLFVF